MAFLIFAIIEFSINPTHSLSALKNGSTVDIISPSISITVPSYPSTIYNNEIMINGTAFDSGKGVKNVQVFVHTFPFDGDFTLKFATPVTPGNWSRWSFPIFINTPGTYRIVAEATDDTGNQNWAETTINIPFIASQEQQDHNKKKIAVVRPTFTEAAYNNHGFYAFYDKYDNSTDVGTNVTTDLDMLTTRIPASITEDAEVKNENMTATFMHWSNLTALFPSDDPNQGFWPKLINNIMKTKGPSTIMTVMRDEDIDDGQIFGPDGSNAYNSLILLHNEYVTQKEYDNLKRFVSNGGTILFIDSNVFYAEVKYDKDNHTVRLVKGHDWEFDGKVARKSVGERWYNETKEWVGGNWLVNSITSKISFVNNPFNYTHFEEQFVNNPNDRIIIDYDIKLPPDYSDKSPLPTGLKQEDIRVATYELKFGRGEVVMIGLYGQNLLNNQDFLKFLDELISKYTLIDMHEN
jgi:N,N-dimethylformamidase beta subunit-like, C-terminal